MRLLVKAVDVQFPCGAVARNPYRVPESVRIPAVNWWLRVTMPVNGNVVLQVACQNEFTAET